MMPTTCHICYGRRQERNFTQKKAVKLKKSFLEDQSEPQRICTSRQTRWIRIAQFVYELKQLCTEGKNTIVSLIDVLPWFIVQLIDTAQYSISFHRNSEFQEWLTWYLGSISCVQQVYVAGIVKDKHVSERRNLKFSLLTIRIISGLDRITIRIRSGWIEAWSGSSSNGSEPHPHPLWSGSIHRRIGF